MLNGPSIAPLSGVAKQLVVILHGYGDSGQGILALGEQWREGLPDAAFVAPNAPDVCEAFAAGFQWFPIRVADGIVTKAFDNADIVREPAKQLNDYIDAQLAHYGLDDSQLAVVGFSQGCMMTLYTMPRRKKPCAAIIGYSGMLVDAQGLKADGIVKPPVLAMHGDRDDVVPPSMLADIEQGMTDAGFNIETAMRTGLGHSIDQFGLMRGLSFLQEHFGIAE